MSDHTNEAQTQARCSTSPCVDCPDCTYCYTRHEPAPGVHQDIPHLNTQCMAEYIISAKQIEHHHHLELDPHKGWHCTTCGEWLPLDYKGPANG